MPQRPCGNLQLFRQIAFSWHSKQGTTCAICSSRAQDTSALLAPIYAGGEHAVVARYLQVHYAAADVSIVCLPLGGGCQSPGILNKASPSDTCGLSTGAQLARRPTHHALTKFCASKWHRIQQIASCCVGRHMHLWFDHVPTGGFDVQTGVDI